MDKLKEVPIWEKANLTIEEAAIYFGVGENRLRDLTDGDGSNCVLWCGRKRLIKRKRMEEFLDKAYSI